MPALGRIGWSCMSVSWRVSQMLMGPLRLEWMMLIAAMKEHCWSLVPCHPLPMMKWCQVESLVFHLHHENIIMICYFCVYVCACVGGKCFIAVFTHINNETNLKQVQPMFPAPMHASLLSHWPCLFLSLEIASQFVVFCHRSVSCQVSLMFLCLKRKVGVVIT